MNVFTAGIWDLFHYGHVRFLENCRKLCGDGELLVGVLTDEAAAQYKEAPIMTYAERAEVVGACRGVDRVISISSSDATEDLKKQYYRNAYRRFGALVHGSDWKPGWEIGQTWVQNSVGGLFVILPYTEGISTSDIRKRLQK